MSFNNTNTDILLVKIPYHQINLSIPSLTSPGRCIRSLHRRLPRLPSGHYQDPPPIHRIPPPLHNQWHHQQIPLPGSIPRYRQRYPGNPTLMYFSPFPSLTPYPFSPKNSTNAPPPPPLSRSLLHNLRIYKISPPHRKPHPLHFFHTSNSNPDPPRPCLLDGRTSVMLHPHPRRSPEAECPDGAETFLSIPPYLLRHLSGKTKHDNSSLRHPRHAPRLPKIPQQPHPTLARLHGARSTQSALHSYPVPFIRVPPLEDTYIPLSPWLPDGYSVGNWCSDCDIGGFGGDVSGGCDDAD